jgi:hypothetical protein
MDLIAEVLGSLKIAAMPNESDEFRSRMTSSCSADY